MTGFSPIQDIALLGASCLGRAARRTANMVTRVYNQHLAAAGIEVTQFTILCCVALERAASTSDLAEMVGVERSTLVRNLDRLKTAGLVRADKGGGRRIVHRLTERGEDTVAAALPLWRNAQDALLERLPPEKDHAIREDFRLLRRAAGDIVGQASSMGNPDEPR